MQQQQQQQQQQWTVAKGVTSSSSIATVNALSTAETNMNGSYSSNNGVSRGTVLQQQQQRQQSLSQQLGAPFSLEPEPADAYTDSVYTALDRLVRDAINDSSPLSDGSNTTPNSPMDVTPLNGELLTNSSPRVLQQLIFQERQRANAHTPNWIAAAAVATLQQSDNVAETSLDPHTGCPSDRDAVTLVQPSLSKQPVSQSAELTSSVAARHVVASSLPQPFSIAAVGTLHPHHGSPQVSGSSTPVELSAQLSHLSTVTPASNGTNSHGSVDVVTTGAVAAGARPSSNAATHYKTKRCRHFDQSGWCPYQHRCIFAHGDREFALYTARKNEATSGTHPKTSQQVRDHIARNVNQLVAEYELAVAEAAANAKTKATSVSSRPSTTAMTMVNNLSPAQSASQVSSAASQHSSVHLTAASPLATGAVTAQATSSTASIPLYHYQRQPQPQPRPQFTVLNQQPVFISTSNSAAVQCAPLPFTSANTAVGTTFTVLPANTTLQAAPQSLCIGHSQPQPQQQQQQQPQPQQQVFFAVQSNSQGVYQLHPQPQQQQQQQIYLVEAPFFHAVQMSSSGASSNVAAMQQQPTQTQSSGHFQAYPSSSHVSYSNGAAFGTTNVVGRYAQ